MSSALDRIEQNAWFVPGPATGSGTFIDEQDFKRLLALARHGEVMRKHLRPILKNLPGKLVAEELQEAVKDTEGDVRSYHPPTQPDTFRLEEMALHICESVVGHRWYIGNVSGWNEQYKKIANWVLGREAEADRKHRAEVHEFKAASVKNHETMAQLVQEIHDRDDKLKESQAELEEARLGIQEATEKLEGLKGQVESVCQEFTANKNTIVSLTSELRQAQNKLAVLTDALRSIAGVGVNTETVAENLLSPWSIVYTVRMRLEEVQDIARKALVGLVR